MFRLVFRSNISIIHVIRPSFFRAKSGSRGRRYIGTEGTIADYVIPTFVAKSKGTTGRLNHVQWRYDLFVQSSIPFLFHRAKEPWNQVPAAAT